MGVTENKTISTVKILDIGTANGIVISHKQYNWWKILRQCGETKQRALVILRGRKEELPGCPEVKELLNA